MKPNIIFMGTPEFAVPALQALHREFGVATVVTAPDKPRGRGLDVHPSAVKIATLELGILDLLQPTSLKDEAFVRQIAERRPDIICVIAFRILPSSVYTLASKGSFNVHASLLPQFRGAAPINHAIISGAKKTGVTSFLLNDVVDTGSILQQYSMPIQDGTTAGELYSALMPLTAECACTTSAGLLSGELKPVAQDDTLASPAPKVFRETSAINWNQDAQSVRNFIHGLSPTPCAWTTWNGEVLKIYRASLSPAKLEAGSWRIIGDEFVVGCAHGSVSLIEVQVPNKRRMQTQDILRGYRGDSQGVFQ